MNYGLPYQGSKNGIAEWVVGQLPAAETFVDLFCGGSVKKLARRGPCFPPILII